MEKENLNDIQLYAKSGNIIAKKLINTRVTSNQITYFGFLCFILSAYFFYRSDYISVLIGMLFLQAGYLADYTDGILARLRNQTSDYGSWLDLISGTFGWTFLFIGITLGVYSKIPEIHVLGFGFSAIISAMLKNVTQSYYSTTFKFSNKFRKEVYKKGGNLLRFTRYTHFLLIPLLTLGALLNKMYYVLIFCGIYAPLYAIAQTIILTLKAKSKKLISL